MISTLVLAFGAGLLSILSPCVLPLLPIVLGTAVSKHRFGAFALAAGLALSFVSIGLFVAVIGFSIGLDVSVFRLVAAVMMVGIGLVLLVPRLQTQFATAAGPISGYIDKSFGHFSPEGLSGQFLLGLLLGAVWSPCVGPTLGAASLLAARGDNLSGVALTMLVFGVGAAVPLILLGSLSREASIRFRTRLLKTGQGGKLILGAMLLVVGALIMTGYDHKVEAILVALSPDWLTNLTTQF